jgi:hypothetical protein
MTTIAIDNEAYGISCGDGYPATGTVTVLVTHGSTLVTTLVTVDTGGAYTAVVNAPALGLGVGDLINCLFVDDAEPWWPIGGGDSSQDFTLGVPTLVTRVTGSAIPLGSTTYRLRCELDTPAGTAGIKLTITGIQRSSGTLLAATAATVWAAGSLHVAATIGDTTATFHTPTTAPEPGDRLLITGGSDQSYAEEVQIASYNGTTDVATFRRELEQDHAISSVVRGLWASYLWIPATALVANEEILVEWRDESTGVRYPQVLRVSDSEIVGADIESRYRGLYPSTWEIVRTRFDDIQRAALERLTAELRTEGRDINKIKDRAALDPVLLAGCRWVALLDTGDGDDSERAVAWEDYLRMLLSLKAAALWFDADDDKTVSDAETSPMIAHWFGRGL